MGIYSSTRTCCGFTLLAFKTPIDPSFSCTLTPRSQPRPNTMEIASERVILLPQCGQARSITSLLDFSFSSAEGTA